VNSLPTLLPTKLRNGEEAIVTHRLFRVSIAVKCHFVQVQTSAQKRNYAAGEF